MGGAPTRHTGNGIKSHGRIGNGSAERAHHIEVSRIWDDTLARDKPMRGLDADDAVPVCWEDDLRLHHQHPPDHSYGVFFPFFLSSSFLSFSFHFIFFPGYLHCRLSLYRG